MADLFYPQLTSGALTQYPIRKTQIVRIIKNILPDGSMFLLPDSGATKTVWQLEYAELSYADIQLLNAHFSACKGPLHAFTFIDPTGNMLTSSWDLTGTAWQRSNLLRIQSGVTDPFAGMAAQTIVNYGQIDQEISQTVRVPANYQYCFSLYARANEQTTFTLFRRGPNLQESSELTVTSGWSRVVSSGRLNDSGSMLTAGISFAAGQQVQIYGIQLEAQIAPSHYQPTSANGGVYTNAHWAMEQLEITAEDVDSYSTTVSIEAAA